MNCADKPSVDVTRALVDERSQLLVELFVATLTGHATHIAILVHDIHFERSASVAFASHNADGQLELTMLVL